MVSHHFDWLAAKETLLVLAAPERGLSAKEIAEGLSLVHGHISRAAVIGRMSRLGLRLTKSNGRGVPETKQKVVPPPVDTLRRKQPVDTLRGKQPVNVYEPRTNLTTEGSQIVPPITRSRTTLAKTSPRMIRNGSTFTYSKVADPDLPLSPPVLVESIGLTLQELRFGNCRWPLWGNEDYPNAKESLYCGLKARGWGSSYCKEHSALAYRVIVK